MLNATLTDSSLDLSDFKKRKVTEDLEGELSERRRAEEVSTVLSGFAA
ncbi:hypothetical protein A2U01_0063593, partial [Trifolium medium]|nr:hypothetical protein [Trifolium medium]